ncbi:Gag-Pol polyprotein/retrotransposon [Parasponia andersonii]|uniref:Gag-Pol polyprotein/retrotransposon n=1 Tax=Parasponia andersonii TaxID=3476 RepID=A0A2P5C8Q0_PARAD|nr:Gag-Pol polyprotein/retrotransposon [Parasponia andersonii]
MAKGGNRSPFARHILEVKAPAKFTPPNLRDYDGSSDPYEHVCHFNQRMQTMSVPQKKMDAMNGKTFTQSLIGLALKCFYKLPLGVTNSYLELTKKFISNFAINIKFIKDSSDLFIITQRSDESLKEYVGWFNKEYIEIHKCEESIVVVAFQKGLIHRSKFYEDLVTKRLLSMEEALVRAKGFMVLEEDNMNYKKLYPNQGKTQERTLSDCGHFDHGYLDKKEKKSRDI